VNALPDLTGRYWPRLQQISAAQSKFAKDDYPPAFYFREIHIMNNWSMNKGELGKTVVEEWKQGYVRIVTEMESEVEGEDKNGKYVDTRYVSTIHRNRTGEIFEHPSSHRGRFNSPIKNLQPPTTAAPPTTNSPPPTDERFEFGLARDFLRFVCWTGARNMTTRPVQKIASATTAHQRGNPINDLVPPGSGK